MSKGFTVKAKVPEQALEEGKIDIQKAREMIKGKSVVFCMPCR